MPRDPTRSDARGCRPRSSARRFSPVRISSSVQSRLRTTRGSNPAASSAAFQLPNRLLMTPASGLRSHSADSGALLCALAHWRSASRISGSLHAGGRGRSNSAARSALFQLPKRRVTWLTGGKRGHSRSQRGWPPATGRQSTTAGGRPSTSAHSRIAAMISSVKAGRKVDHSRRLKIRPLEG
jgi:hypothetical protein